MDVPGDDEKYIMVDVPGKKKKKVNTGVVFKVQPVTEQSSFADCAEAAFGRDEPMKVEKGKKKGRQVDQLCREVLLFDQGTKARYGYGLGFTAYPANPRIPVNGVPFYESFDVRHWSRVGEHHFFIDYFTYGNCPAFFEDGKTLCWYFDRNNIRTVSDLEEHAASFQTDEEGEESGEDEADEMFELLADAYLHELNCRYFREHGNNDHFVVDLDTFNNGVLDLGGPHRVSGVKHWYTPETKAAAKKASVAKKESEKKRKSKPKPARPGNFVDDDGYQYTREKRNKEYDRYICNEKKNGNCKRKKCSCTVEFRWPYWDNEGNVLGEGARERSGQHDLLCKPVGSNTGASSKKKSA